MSKTLRIGGGSASGASPPREAVELAAAGIDYLGCDRLAERTLANATIERQEDPSRGYDPKLESWFSAVLPAVAENDVTLIGNFGSANPPGAAAKIVEIGEELGYGDLTVATITGDDVRGDIDIESLTHMETGRPLREEISAEIVSANAYVGCEGIVEALANDADIVVGGRITDTSLFLGPLLYEFGWGDDDWQRLADGIVAGNLLECGGLATGSVLSRPGYVDIPDIRNVGNPIVEVSEDGDVVLTKPEDTGGAVTELTTIQKLCWEVQDPAEYVTPEVVVDITKVEIDKVGEDRVTLHGAIGKPRPQRLKVLVGEREGFIVETELGWGGEDSLQKADAMVENVVEPALAELADEFGPEIVDTRVDRIGIDAIHGDAASEPGYTPNEVRLRIAAKVRSRSVADEFIESVERTRAYVGAGGFRRSVQSYINLHPTLVPRETVETTVQYRTVGR